MVISNQQINSCFTTGNSVGAQLMLQIRHLHTPLSWLCWLKSKTSSIITLRQLNLSLKVERWNTAMHVRIVCGYREKGVVCNWSHCWHYYCVQQIEKYQKNLPLLIDIRTVFHLICQQYMGLLHDYLSPYPYNELELHYLEMFAWF